MINKESFLFLLFSIISVSLGIFTTVLLSKYFTSEEFGRIQFVLVLVSTFSVFKFIGFDIVIQKQIYKEEYSYLGFILQKLVPASFLLLSISIIGYYYLFYQGDILSLLVVYFITLFSFLDRSQPILNAKLKFKKIRYIELALRSSLFLLVVFIIIFKIQISNFLIMYCITLVLISLAKLITSTNELNYSIFKVYKVEGKDKELFFDGVKNSISTAFLTLSNWVEKIILGHIDYTALAVFSIGQMIPRVVKDNCKILLIPSLNTWASKGICESMKELKKNSLYLWLLGLICFISVFFISKLFITYFIPDYNGSIYISQILSITLIFKFVETAKMSLIALSEHTEIFNNINNVFSSIKIIMCLSIIPLFNINGAIISILVVDIIRFILVSHSFRTLELKYNV